jgi:AcrR family transcriptional regulator
MSRATSSTTTGETPPAASERDPRREILDAASALLYEGGPEGLTIRRLALRSGYTSPAIYHHFGDKAGLLDAVLQHAIEGLHDRLRQLPVVADPREQMRMHFKEIVRYGHEHPTNYRLMEAIPQEQVLPSAEAMRLHIEAPLEGLARAVDVDPELLRQALWALLHGLISLPASRPDVEWRDGLADVAFDAMVDGLLGSGRGGGMLR